MSDLNPLVAQLVSALKGADPERLRELVRGHRELDEIKKNLGPQTKDELWDYFKERYKIELGTVSVCPGHISQLDLVWEVYSFVPNILWVLSRGYGKCVAKGTMVYDPETGKRFPVEELCDGREINVAAMNKQGYIVPAKAFGEPQGDKDCLRVTLRSGRVIILSWDHPLLTSSSWRKVEDLFEGDHVALPRILPEPELIVPFGDGELDMLAVLLSEGSYTSTSVGFSTSDPKILEIMSNAVDPYGCQVVHSHKYDYRLAYSKRIKNPIRQMLDSVGISHEGARNKKIPDILWSASNEQVARFLSIFWMCDGYVEIGGPRICLSSEVLVRDIGRLLLRLGIQSAVSRKNASCNGKSFQAWILSVRGSCYRRFFDRITLWGKKHERMSEIISKKTNTNLGRPAVSKELMDNIDYEIKSLTREERRERGFEIAEMLEINHHQGMAGIAGLAQKNRKTFSSERFWACIDTLPNRDWSEYEYLGSEDLWWDEVTMIEELGKIATYDICVPEYNNFVANDILVHNTSLMALTDDCQATHYPGWSSFTIGPGKNQGERKYDHLLPYVVEGGVIGGKELSHIERSTTTRTEYKNGSKIEISLGGDPANANGPRDPRLHRDEIELMLEATRRQAANIPAGKKTRDGRYVPAQTVDTSTMKWAGGYVHEQLEEYLGVLAEANVDPTQMDPIEAHYLAIERGFRPHTAVRVSCLFEVVEENPTCRSVPEEERRKRLIELKRDPDEICNCQTYRKDFWPSDDPDLEATPRTLEDVCQGRFFRSRGHKEFTDVIVLFLANDRETWEAEQECSEPSREGAYLRAYSQDRHGIGDYDPDPDNGPIFSSTDWGGTDAHWHGWFQELERDVYVNSYKGNKVKRMPAGSSVAFGEIMRPEIGNIELGKLVQAQERIWIIKYPGWRVEERYHDYAGKSGMLDWRDQLGMHMIARIKKDFIEEVRLVRTRVGGWFFYIVIKKCPNLDKALRGWRQVNGREVKNQHTHPMAGMRYYEHERHVVKRALMRAGSKNNRPAAAGDEDERPQKREQELERGIRVIRHGQPRNSRQELAAVAGAEDSPLREGSSSVTRPDLRTERID